MPETDIWLVPGARDGMGGGPDLPPMFPFRGLGKRRMNNGKKTYAVKTSEERAR